MSWNTTTGMFKDSKKAKKDLEELKKTEHKYGFICINTDYCDEQCGQKLSKDKNFKNKSVTCVICTLKLCEFCFKDLNLACPGCNYKLSTSS